MTPKCSFPKWGLANGKDQIGQLFGDFSALLREIRHDYATFNFIMTGSDVFACEGTSYGVHRDGAWRAGVTHAGRWCDVFEVRDFLIQRCFIYLDPDYAGHAALSMAFGTSPRRVEAHGLNLCRGFSRRCASTGTSARR